MNLKLVKETVSKSGATLKLYKTPSYMCFTKNGKVELYKTDAMVLKWFEYETNS